MKRFGLDGSDQNASMVSISKVPLSASVTISASMSSPREARCGLISLVKNESMVPIGASSSSIINCSLSASERSLGSASGVEPSEPVESCFILSRSLPFISSAARFVNVSSTTSPGSRPSHSLGSVSSFVSFLTLLSDILRGLSGIGSISVALCLRER